MRCHIKQYSGIWNHIRCSFPMQASYKLLCDTGCKDWNDANAQLDECTTGKSASNALVGRKSFVRSPKHATLMRTLGFTLSRLQVDIQTGTSELLDLSPPPPSSSSARNAACVSTRPRFGKSFCCCSFMCGCSHGATHHLCAHLCSCPERCPGPDRRGLRGPLVPRHRRTEPAAQPRD